MRTFSAKANEVQRQWWVIDAADQVLGRVAVKAATLLRGKEKAMRKEFERCLERKVQRDLL